MGNRAALEGNLRDTSLASVIEELQSDGRTGVLRVGDSGEVWLNQGRVYLVGTAQSADVGEVLFGAGIAPLDEIQQALNLGGPDVAGKLVDRHPPGSPVLARLLHEHNLTGLFEMLVPTEDDYRFEAESAHAVGARFAEPTDELLAQATRRLEIWRQIAASIPNTALSFRLAKQLPEEAEERLITSDEWRYLSLLDGDRSVAGVISETNESAFRVCSALYRLLLEGLIEQV